MKSMKKLQMIMLSLLTIFGIATIVATPSYAINVFDGCGSGGDAKVCDAGNKDQVTPIFKNILSLLLYAIGAIAVIMIVIGGIKYATSNGDSNSIQSAKNTILYSVIGLVVAILGQAIILFVVNWLK